jgi:acetyl-CoA carboxylase biotin carboxyl carrier protein
VSADALPSWSDLLALVERLEHGDFEDFVVEMPGLTVRVSRHGFTDTAVAGAAAAGAVPATATPGAEPRLSDSARPEGAEITAPIVGVFYRRPAPDQPPFVAVDDEVSVGATTAIIEVMKMMVPVEAGVAGRIVAVLADDGDLVEFGQPLFIFDTSGAT